MQQDSVTRGAGRRSRKKKSLSLAAKILISAGIVAVGIIGAMSLWYVQEARQFRQVFFDNTTINGVDASRMTVKQVEEAISDGVRDYALTLHGRGGITGQITGEEIDLHAVFDGTMEEILAAQEPYQWWFRRRNPVIYQIDAMTVFDQEKLEKALADLDFFDASLQQEPVDAYLSDYIPGTGYQIMPETEGTVLIWDTVRKRVTESVVNLQREADLESWDAYKEAPVNSEDMALLAAMADRNRIVNVTVTYQFGDVTETLDGTTTSQWLTEHEDGGIGIDAAQAAEYVKSLAARYNTAYKPKSLKTSYGRTVSISGGHYGWRINQTGETEALLEILKNGESQSREPVYSQTANSHGSNDYGDTYVEINLTAQHLYFYKNGELVVESDFVSGNKAKGYDTPAGAYPLTYKQRNATLKGEGYATPVDYWMPFNGGIGMHDADWRSSFGGKIYKTNGSHGCINLPPSVAKTIYEQIAAGDPVLCYHLEGTESGASSQPAVSGQTTAAEQTTAAAQSTAVTQTQMAESTAQVQSPDNRVPQQTTEESQDSGAQGTGSQITVPTAAAPAETASLETGIVSPAETTAAVVPTGAAPVTWPQNSPVEPGVSTTQGAQAQEYGPGAGR